MGTRSTAAEVLNLLVVEDNPADARLIQELLKEGSTRQVSTRVAGGMRDALEMLRGHRFSAVLLDLGLPDSQGLSTLTQIAAQSASTPVVVLTGLDDERLATLAVQGGAQDYLIKGRFDGYHLYQSVRHAIDRQSAADALRESEARFRQLVDNVKEAFLLLEQPGHRPLYVSRVWEEIFGRSIDAYTSDPGLRLEAVYEADRATAGAIDDLMARGESATGIYRIVRPDQSERWVRSRAFPVRTADGRLHRTVNLLEDITDVRRTEELLQQSQKMEAVGQLAGGIAHDFNNLLTGIMAYSEMLIEDLGPAHPSGPSIEWILSAAESAGRLTGQLLAFSRRQVVQFQSLDLNDVILRVEPLLRRTLGEHIRIDLALDKAPVPVRGDPGQVEQIVMNLAVNARDAMPMGGSLTIATANLPGRPGAGIGTSPRGAAVPRVLLSVTDTGTGMDQATQQRIFEPFFTTKPIGRGTGLGLATVYGIVTQSGGTIEVRSTPGRGSVFTVLLPADARAPERIAATAATPESLRGSETILIVEDEPATRKAICGMVSRRGYTVIAADGGEDARRKSRAHEGRIDLLLTDIVMPGLNGRNVAELLRRERPEMRVLFMSGYTGGALVEDFILNGDIAFIQKPFSSDGIARKLRSILDRPAPPLH